MTLQFRETSPQDAPAVAAFLQRVFNAGPGLPLTDPDLLRWKCWEPHPDWTGSRGYVVTDDDRIVAHGTVVPLTLLHGQRRLAVPHLIDWAADPESAGSGMFLMNRIARMVDAVIAFGGSEKAEKVLPAFGFKTHGEVTKFARPLRPWRRLVGEKPGLRAGARLGRSLLWWLRAPSAGTHGWTAKRIDPRELEPAGMHWTRAAEGVAHFERTAQNTTYLLRCPSVRMEFYAVAKDGRGCGYFLLAHLPWQVRIAHFYAASNDREDWRSLVHLAVSQAKGNLTAAEVVALGSDPVTSQALADCGFHARGTHKLRLLAPKGLELPAGPIRFHMIDCDAAYLHANESGYWG